MAQVCLNDLLILYQSVVFALVTAAPLCQCGKSISRVQVNSKLVLELLFVYYLFSSLNL